MNQDFQLAAESLKELAELSRRVFKKDKESVDLDFSDLDIAEQKRFLDLTANAFLNIATYITSLTYGASRPDFWHLGIGANSLAKKIKQACNADDFYNVIYGDQLVERHLPFTRAFLIVRAHWANDEKAKNLLDAMDHILTPVNAINESTGRHRYINAIDSVYRNTLGRDGEIKIKYKIEVHNPDEEFFDAQRRDLSNNVKTMEGEIKKLTDIETVIGSREYEELRKKWDALQQAQADSNETYVQMIERTIIDFIDGNPNISATSDDLSRDKEPDETCYPTLKLMATPSDMNKISELPVLKHRCHCAPFPHWEFIYAVNGQVYDPDAVRKRREPLVGDISHLPGIKKADVQKPML